MPTLHAHLDESGDLNFSPRGSKYYVFSLAWTYDPAPLARALTALRFAFLKSGTDLNRFHAAEDRQVVRDAVVSALTQHHNWYFAAIVVEKAKVNPVLRDPEHFYPKFAAMLLRFLLKGWLVQHTQHVLVFTDTIPVRRKRDSVGKAIKVACRTVLSPTIRFHSFHHPCTSNTWLQTADYCSWAVYRKWENNDPRTYSQLKVRLVKDELDTLARGQTRYY